MNVEDTRNGVAEYINEKYGDKDFNKEIRAKGCRRLFLHAKSLEFSLPSSDKSIKVSAELSPELDKVLQNLSG